MSALPSLSSSTYVIDRAPQRFGGQQRDYEERSQRIVEQTAQEFRDAVRNGLDLTEVFHRVLGDLGRQRGQIARDHGYADKGRFGIARDSEEGFLGPVAMTILTRPYEAYNPKVVSVMQRYLRRMGHSLREFTEKEKSFPEASSLGRRMKTTVNIYSSEDQEKWLAVDTREKVSQLYELSGVPLPEDRSLRSEQLAQILTENRAAMIRLKERSPEKYKFLKLNQIISQMRRIETDRRKSDFALVSRYLEIDNKLYAITQFLTWMYRDFMQDPVEKMSHHSVAALIHQDPFIIKSTLDGAAKVFKEAIECNREDLKTLKEKVLLVNFLAAHAMRSSRGESAIIEWLERAIYAYHGLKVEYNQSKMVNLEALTSTLDEFAREYDSCVAISPIK